MKKSGFAWLPVVTAIAAVGIVGWLYWYSQHQTELTDNNPAVKELQSEVQDQKQPATTTAQQTQTPPSATIQPAPAQSMSEYTDTDYKFSFKYPSGFTIKTLSYANGSNLKSIQVSTSTFATSFHISVDSGTLDFGPPDPSENYKDTLVGTVTFGKQQVRALETTADDANSYTSYYLQLNNGVILGVTVEEDGYAGAPDQELSASDIQSVLDSFDLNS